MAQLVRHTTDVDFGVEKECGERNRLSQESLRRSLRAPGSTLRTARPVTDLMGSVTAMVAKPFRPDRLCSPS